MLVSDPSAPAKRRVKILDFGIAKMLPDGSAKEAANAATRTGTLIGTPMYMSPEQCRASAPPDEKTDVYSLGIILYEMLYGEPPFTSESAGELFALQMFADPPRLKQRVPAIPDQLDELVHRLLAKQPATRPSMVELATALESITSTGLEDGAAQDRPSVASSRARSNQGEEIGSTSGIVRAQLPGNPRQADHGERVATPSPKKGALVLVILSATFLLVVIAVLLILRNRQPVALPPVVTNGIQAPPPSAAMPDAGTNAGAGPSTTLPASPPPSTATDPAANGKHSKSGKSGKASHKAVKTGAGNKLQVDLWK